MTRLFLICLTFWFSISNLCQAQQQQPELVDISFQAKVDGTEQRYVLIEPLSPPKGQIDLLIALHGHGSDRWQFARDQRDECLALRQVAQKHQMLFVSPDYRAKTSWMGPLAEADLQQIISELREERQVRHVYLCGGSMGGTSALTFTAIHPELIDGVVALNATANHLEYDQFQDAISESFGGRKSQIPAEYKKRSAEYWPEHFRIPVGLTTGGQDQIVPPHSVSRLASVLKNLEIPIRHLHRENGGHDTNLEDTLEVMEFVIAEVQKSSPPRLLEENDDSRSPAP